jgi:hypothetical protein
MAQGAIYVEVEYTRRKYQRDVEWKKTWNRVLKKDTIFL